MTAIPNAQVDVEGASNAGQVVGIQAASPFSGFSWSALSGIVEFDDFFPYGVNDKGLMVGTAAARVGGPPMDLGLLEGFTSYTALDVNRSGVVTGCAPLRKVDRYELHAVVWRPRADVAVNFGAGVGVWRLGESDWSPIHGLSPESVTAADVDGNGLDDLVMDFGNAYGVWLWLNHATWMQLHGASPTDVAAGDLDWNGKDELVFNFPGQGVWIWRNHSAWQPLHGVNAQGLSVGNLDGVNGDDVIVDLQGMGVWVFMNNSAWTLLHGESPSRLLTGDLDGNGKDDVLIDFASLGLWIYWNNTTWEQLHTLHPVQMAIGDPIGAAKASLVLDFGSGAGIWQWRHQTGWAFLHGAASAGIVLADRDANGKDEILINFGAGGLWQVPVIPAPGHSFTVPDPLAWYLGCCIDSGRRLRFPLVAHKVLAGLLIGLTAAGLALLLAGVGALEKIRARDLRLAHPHCREAGLDQQGHRPRRHPEQFHHPSESQVKRRHPERDIEITS